MMDPATWLGMVTSGWSEIGQATFWVALLQIMWINILLSGDNAVVIAMACRGLPHRQRVWGMILGGLALFYIAAKLLVPEESDESETEATEHLWRAVKIVAIADMIMSLDNVIAIAAAAKGN